MKFGCIIIGDEILSGKRQDKHLPKVIELLSARGLKLAWAEYLGDDAALCESTFRRTFALADTVVFSMGGIGATPDDHTRQCAGQALGLPLQLHAEAKRLIEERSAEMGQPVTPQRLMMGEFPAGAGIIPNPYNKIAGFAMAGLRGSAAAQAAGNAHYFVPGFPVMAWPMVEWVLDTHYKHLHHATPHAELSVWVYGVGESQLIDMMKAVERDFGVTAFSLPSVPTATERARIEFGVKGDPAKVAQAMEVLDAGLKTIGAEVHARG
jgi:molybdopterin-biosynthesis enzyme MoeA-like protein